MKNAASPGSSDLSSVLLVGGLIAICCGAPLLLAALALTGLGVWLLSQGAVVLALAVLGAAGTAALWRHNKRRIRRKS